MLHIWIKKIWRWVSSIKLPPVQSTSPFLLRVKMAAKIIPINRSCSGYYPRVEIWSCHPHRGWEWVMLHYNTYCSPWVLLVVAISVRGPRATSRSVQPRPLPSGWPPPPSPRAGSSASSPYPRSQSLFRLLGTARRWDGLMLLYGRYQL